MVKRRERRVGGCERSIARRMNMVEARNGGCWCPRPFAAAHFVVSDNCDGDNESV